MTDTRKATIADRLDPYITVAWALLALGIGLYPFVSWEFIIGG